MSAADRWDDCATRLAILRSYWRVADPVTWFFLTCRIASLPLNRFSRHIPVSGKIVEVGCGHGLVAQYLAHREKGRNIVGCDPDRRRILVAKAAAKAMPNLEYRESRFEEGHHQDLAAVVIIGVLCLVDDATSASVLSEARGSLRPGGLLLLSDILKGEGDWRYAFHVWRENWLGRIGFTRGQGIFVRPLSDWERLVRGAGFSTIEAFQAPVPMHSVFNWICK